MPSITLTCQELDDLELTLHGVPLRLTPGDPAGDGTLCLLVRSNNFSATNTQVLRLLDREGAELAEFETTNWYPTDGAVALIGHARQLASRAARPFEWLYRKPIETARGAGPVLLVPVAAPLTASDLHTVRQRHAGRRVLFLALAGAGSPRGVSTVGLLRASLAAADLLPDAEVVAVPLASRGDPKVDGELHDRILAAYCPPDSEIFYPGYCGPLPPEIAAVVERDRPTGTAQGLVVFFTGLSGSGKSTIARGVRNALIESGDRKVTLLDGDVVRRHLSSGLGFSREDRDTNVRRIGWVAAEISRHGGTAIASPIAPFAATRDAVYSMAEDSGGAFLLVHVATPLDECERRDRKGLYARARAGEIPDFTGISSPYDEPRNPDLRIDTTECTELEAVDTVLRELHTRGFIA